MFSFELFRYNRSVRRYHGFATYSEASTAGSDMRYQKGSAFSYTVLDEDGNLVSAPKTARKS